MDTFARKVAVDLTGRTKWAEGKGPEGFQGDHIDLLVDMLFQPRVMFRRELIPLERKPLKERLGLDTDKKFFAPATLMLNEELHEISGEMRAKKERNNRYHPSGDEKAANTAEERMSAMAFFVTGKALSMVPVEGTETFAAVGITDADHGVDDVQLALIAMQDAFLLEGDMNAAVDNLISAINAHGEHSNAIQSQVGLEVLYNEHNPWRKAAVAIILSLLLLTARWVVKSKILTVLLALAIAWALAEQVFGLWLRVSILGRAPVSNTYEAILWMGLVTVVIGLIGQALQPKSWYLAGGLAASVLAIFFAMLVPLQDQTNSLPAVLRSNYWLIIHVLTIVASYAALMLAAVLAHVFLVKDVLLRRPSERSNRVIVQVYRVIQIGTILLTAGTILGGVWAADSWGRFWGWDPKETWSLISIIIYAALMHARYVGWIRDFGLAVAAIVGFLAIIWTFYGVNYIMASGLHSYGFGSGGEKWVILWALFEIAFIALCFVRKPSKPNRKKQVKLSSNNASPTPAT